MEKMSGESQQQAIWKGFWVPLHGSGGPFPLRPLPPHPLESCLGLQGLHPIQRQPSLGRGVSGRVLSSEP